MAIKEKVRGRIMQKEVALNAADVTSKMAVNVAKPNAAKPVATDSGQVNYVAKTITIRDDQFDDVTSMAAYNKLKRRDPDTVSSVIREALDLYIAQADDAYRYI